MSKDLKRGIDNSELDLTSISPVKHFRRDVICLLDLPDEILLIICRYLSPSCVLYSFYTPELPNMRFHHLISDYYTKIQLDAITYDEYIYLSSLLSHSTYPLQPESLILSNKHVSCLTYRYFLYMNTSIIHSIFVNLKRLTLIDCTPNSLENISRYYYMDMKQLEYFHITVRKLDKDINVYYTRVADESISQLIFNRQMCALHTFINNLPNGFILNKSLKSHQTLRHIDIVLQTIDDLYILLDGLVPNVEKMIVQLCQSRLLTSRRPQRTSICSRLIEFTLLDSHIGLIIDDIQFVLGYMQNLIKLTLSIRDTSDPIFCHGTKFESILNEYVSNLEKFDYTITHRISDTTLIEDFLRWPMNIVFYGNENCKWIHIYSFPWPSNREDKRRLPIVNNGSNISVLSDVQQDKYIEHVMITKHNELIELKTRFRHAYQLTTGLSIDIKLPSRFSKVILTTQIPINANNSIAQPFVCHLIVERRLVDESEISALAHQFPNVKYLQLLFPLDSSTFLRCFKTLFSNDDDNKSCFWSQLVNFRTVYVYQQLNTIMNDSNLHHLLIENTDIKYRQRPFYANYSDSMFSIWL